MSLLKEEKAPAFDESDRDRSAGEKHAIDSLLDLRNQKPAETLQGADSKTPLTKRLNKSSALNGTSLDESFSDVLKTYVRSSLRLNVTPDERYSRFVAAIKDEKNASPNDIKDLRRRKLLLMNFPNTKEYDILVVAIDANKDANTLTTNDVLRVVAVSQIEKTIKQVHNIESLHAGYRKTYKRICERYSGIPKSLVYEYVKRCGVCQSSKPRSIRGPLQPIIQEAFGERFLIDLADFSSEPITLPDGQVFRYVLVCKEHFTKAVILVPLKDKTGEHVTEQYLRSVIAFFGPSEVTQSDNGPEFKNSTLEALMAAIRSKFVHGVPRKPSTQGAVETAVKNFKRKALALAKEKKMNWHQALPYIQYAINSEIHEATGVSPYEMLFGRRPPPMEPLICTAPALPAVTESLLASLQSAPAPSMFLCVAVDEFQKYLLPSAFYAFLMALNPFIPVSANHAEPFRNLTSAVQGATVQESLIDMVAAVPVEYMENESCNPKRDAETLEFSDAFVAFWGAVNNVNIFRMRPDSSDCVLVTSDFEEDNPSCLLRQRSESATACETWLQEDQMLSSSSALLREMLVKAGVSTSKNNPADRHYGVRKRGHDNFIHAVGVMEKRYNASSKTTVFQVGAIVGILVPPSQRRLFRFSNLPSKVIEKKHPHLYRLRCEFGVVSKWMSVRDLVPLPASSYPTLRALSSDSSSTAPTIAFHTACREYDKRFSIEVNLEQTFFPEYIIKERKVKGKIEFLIKWKGFSTKESTWEPKSSFLSDTVLLSDWHQRQLADEFSESFPRVKRVKFCLSSEVVHQRALDVPRTAHQPESISVGISRNSVGQVSNSSELPSDAAAQVSTSASASSIVAQPTQQLPIIGRGNKVPIQHEDCFVAPEKRVFKIWDILEPSSVTVPYVNNGSSLCWVNASLTFLLSCSPLMELAASNTVMPGTGLSVLCRALNWAAASLKSGSVDVPTLTEQRDHLKQWYYSTFDTTGIQSAADFMDKMLSNCRVHERKSLLEMTCVNAAQRVTCPSATCRCAPAGAYETIPDEEAFFTVACGAKPSSLHQAICGPLTGPCHIRLTSGDSETVCGEPTATCTTILLRLPPLILFRLRVPGFHPSTKPFVTVKLKDRESHERQYRVAGFICFFGSVYGPAGHYTCGLLSPKGDMCLYFDCLQSQGRSLDWDVAWKKYSSAISILSLVAEGAMNTIN